MLHGASMVGRPLQSLGPIETRGTASIHGMLLPPPSSVLYSRWLVSSWPVAGTTSGTIPTTTMNPREKFWANMERWIRDKIDDKFELIHYIVRLFCTSAGWRGRTGTW